PCIPGAASGPRDRRNDCHLGSFADAGANFPDEARHLFGAEIEIGPQVMIGRGLGQPESAPQRGGKSDVALEEALYAACYISLEAFRIGAAFGGGADAMIAEAETHQALKHRILAHKAHLVVIAMRIWRVAGGFERKASDRIAFGNIHTKADGVVAGG